MSELVQDLKMSNKLEVEKLIYRESHLRSLLKGVSWRVIASLTTISIAYVITGKIDIALEIGAIEVVAKVFLYYAHERIWQLLPRGAVRKLRQHYHRIKQERNK